ncbi:ECF transporter S component [Clostridium manihotivorum]|uniref:ECF transporter S component n=1 Tax=Clostridium manihotivorum TaxID=2320868 RepID=A0A410DYJ3_9CLOT|nr:ECF transporter S component [Clostridium manihotivorum]QAA34142.1 ECF transporter S component [Clostridium manihotivorum]
MEKGLNKSNFSTRQMVTTAMLAAISIFLGLSGLGFIKIPPVNATIMHIPVIIGSIIEGPIVGGLIGLCFGLFSMYQAFTAPTPTSFVFWNPIVALLPRILIGVISYYAFVGIKKTVKINAKASGMAVIAFLSIMIALALKIFFPIYVSCIIAAAVFVVLTFLFIKYKLSEKSEVLSIGTASLLGTLTNTVLVLTLIYVFYVDRFAKAINVNPTLAGKAIVTIGMTNGIPEALISTIIVVPVVMAILKIRK